MRDGKLVQMPHSCYHVETIRHPNSSYATTKLYGTSTCGCNNNTNFSKRATFNVSYRRCMPRTLAWRRAGLVPARYVRHASFFFWVRIMLGTILGRFSIIYFRGLGLRIKVMVWVMVRARVRVWVRVGVGVGVRVSVVLWSW